MVWISLSVSLRKTTLLRKDSAKNGPKSVENRRFIHIDLNCTIFRQTICAYMSKANHIIKFYIIGWLTGLLVKNISADQSLDILPTDLSGGILGFCSLSDFDLPCLVQMTNSLSNFAWTRLTPFWRMINYPSFFIRIRLRAFWQMTNLSTF